MENTSNTRKMFKCAFCGRSRFVSYRGLKRHRLKEHATVRCDCGRKFMAERDMNQHRKYNKIHSGYGEPFISMTGVHGISHSLGALRKTDELYEQQAGDLGSYVEKNIQADSLFRGCCGEVIESLVEHLEDTDNIPEMIIKSRILKSGSLGKTTAVKGRSDIDLVLMLAKYNNVRKLWNDMPNILTVLQRYLERHRAVATKKPTRFSVPAEVTCSSGHKHDVDILPAVDLLELGNSEADVYRLMKEESSDMIHEFSVSLAPLQIDIIKHLPTKVKDLIKLVKYWKDKKLKEKGEPEMPSFSERGASDPKWPSSFALELVVMAAWLKAGRPDDFSMVHALHSVLTSLVEHERMRITFPGIMKYKEDMIKYRLYHISSVPYIMDPTNPYNDMYHGLVNGQAFDWYKVVTHAQTWLSKSLFDGVEATKSWT